MIGSPLAHRFTPAVNISERQGGQRPDILLLHYTGTASAEAALIWLCARQSKVSCHYLVDEDGEIVQMVDERLRAAHAGVSSWGGATQLNERSIGIEIHNPGHEHGYRDFPDRQMRAVVDLSQDIVGRWGIAPERVLGHADVAPTRKEDPGERFDWAWLARAGLGHWVEPEPIAPGPSTALGDSGEAVRELQAMLCDYGYGIEPSGHYDDLTAAVVTAFQRHFRQARVDGIADVSTVATLRRLSEALARSRGKLDVALGGT